MLCPLSTAHVSCRSTLSRIAGEELEVVDQHNTEASGEISSTRDHGPLGGRFMRRQRGTGGGRSRSGASGDPIDSGSGGAGAHPAAVAGVSTGERASADLAALALATKPDSPNSVNIFPVRSPDYSQVIRMYSEIPSESGLTGSK